MLRRKETALTEGSRKRSKTILDSRAPRTFYRSRTALLSAMPSLLKIDRGGTPYVFHRLPSKAHSATPSTRFVVRPPIAAAVKVAAPHREAAWSAKGFRGCGLHRPPFYPRSCVLHATARATVAFQNICCGRVTTRRPFAQWRCRHLGRTQNLHVARLTTAPKDPRRADHRPTP